MKKRFVFLQLIALLSLVCVLITACAPSSAIEVRNFQDGEITTHLITEERTFDQCNSDSSLDHLVQFSDSSSLSTQSDLTLSGNTKAGAQVDDYVTVTLESAIQAHMGSSVGHTSGASESTKITVPPHKKQVYTLVWEESRQVGSIEYMQSNQIKFANYSYRLGVKLLNESGVDISCTTPVTPHPLPSPTTQAVPESHISDGIAGSWSGKLDSSSARELFITVKSGCDVGQVCGSYSTTSPGCNGNLLLQDVQGDIFVFVESLSMGGQSCANGNFEFIQLVSQDAISVKIGGAPWITSAQESGTLTKQ